MPEYSFQIFKDTIMPKGEEIPSSAKAKGKRLKKDGQSDDERVSSDIWTTV